MTKAAAFRRRAVRSVLAAALVTTTLVTTALSPAQAHDREDSDLSGQLSDRGNQMRAAATLSALTGALLAMDIAPITRAMRSAGDEDFARDLPPDATLGDLAGPRAQELPYDIARKTPEMMGKAAGMAGALEEMRPQLKAMARKFKDQLRGSGLSDYP